MDTKSIKSHLKEAKEAIKNKDVDRALKLCKAVLKEDHKNYLALVILGAALNESGSKDDSLNTYRKAKEISPQQILAWQGLASFFEKNGIENYYNDALPVYKELLYLETNDDKKKEIIDKIRNISMKYNCVDFVKVFENCLDNELMVDLLYEYFTKKNIDYLDCWKKILRIKIKEPEYFDEYCSKYCQVLYSCKEYDVLKNFCLDFLSKCKDVSILEWICQIQFDHFLGLTVEKIEDDSCYEKLLQLKEESEIGCLVKAAKLFEAKDYPGCRDILNYVLEFNEKNPLVWYFLSKVHCVLNSFEELVSTVALTEKYLCLKNYDYIRSDLRIWKLEALSNSNEKNCQKCIDLCNEILSTNPEDCNAFTCIIRAAINLEDWALVESKLSNLDESDVSLIFLKALYCYKINEIDKAVIILRENLREEPEYFNYFLLLGKIYKQEGNNKEALNLLLKAAKSVPHIFSAFLELGHYYKDVNKDLDKARRCYQKAFQLNPYSEKCGISLSDVYRKLNCQESNYELLNTVTVAGTSSWVWLRLGLYYLDTNNIKLAVDTLRSAVRVNPTDSCSWECLGDAYYYRGSYVSALKCYQKCLELNPKLIYAVFQIATIKQLISLHDESISEFRMLVEQNPDRIPALKGLAEVCLLHAKELMDRQIIAAARDLCEEASDCLTRILKQNKSLASVWKLFGDTCMFVGQLPDRICYLNLSVALFDATSINMENYEKTSATRMQLLDFALKCYLIAINLNSDKAILSFLWHDISSCYNLQAKFSTDKISLKKYALSGAKKSVSLAPKVWEHWNLLGVIALSKEIDNRQLAQHCFIKAIELDNNCAVSWCNLGVLYLQAEDISLANEAFQHAQRSDPKYARSWIGQALIAEFVESVETVDLFYHTTQLGYHQESAKGFAEWICKILKNWDAYKNNQHCYYIVEKMAGLQVAVTVATWYTVHYPEDAFAMNMLGILLELCNLNRSAVKVSLEALEHVTGEGDIVRSNLGRQLRKNKKYRESVKILNQIKQADFSTQCNLALSLLMAGEYQESLAAYDAAIQWFAPDEGAEAQVMVATAALKYMCKLKDEAQMILFQCIQLKPVPVYGLFAACAFGMLNSELKLSKLVLKELEAFEKQPEYIRHIAVFKTYCDVFQNNFRNAINIMSKFVFNHPGDPNLWFSLCLLLLYVLFDGKKEYKHFGTSAAYHAKCAITLGRGNIDISKMCSLSSLSYLLAGSSEECLRNSMKAVHMYPDVAESWAVLIAVLYSRGNDYKSLLSMILQIKSQLKCSKPLNAWLNHIEQKVTSILD